MPSLSSRGNAEDAAGEALVDVERLLAGHRMGAHDRVLGARIALLVGDPVIGVLAAIVLAVMQRGQPFEIGLHAVRQRVVGGIHAGEQRVAAARRALPDVEDAAHRRLGVAATRRECQPSPLARGLSLSAWMIISSGWPGSCGAAGWMCSSPNRRPKSRCWSWRQVLVAEEDHQFSASARWISSICRLPAALQIDAADLGADDRRQLVDADRLIGRVVGRGTRSEARYGCEVKNS